MTAFDRVESVSVCIVPYVLEGVTRSVGRRRRYYSYRYRGVQVPTLCRCEVPIIEFMFSL